MGLENLVLKQENIENIENIKNEVNIKQKVKIKRKRVTKEKNENIKEFKIPEYTEYENVTNKLLIPQLKDICRHYKLKVSGKKQELVERARKYLKHSAVAIILQSKIKRRFTHEWLKLHGLGLFDRSVCVNDSDIMGDDLTDIKYNKFFSFTDQGFTYGFDISTFKEIILKSKRDRITRERKVINPYTRDEIEDNIISDFYKLLKYTKYLFSKNNLICIIFFK